MLLLHRVTYGPILTQFYGCILENLALIIVAHACKRGMKSIG